jgi:hypothetical protein
MAATTGSANSGESRRNPVFHAGLRSLGGPSVAESRQFVTPLSAGPHRVRVRSEASQSDSRDLSRAPSASPCRAGIRSAAVTGKRACAPRWSSACQLAGDGVPNVAARDRIASEPSFSPSFQPSAAGLSGLAIAVRRAVRSRTSDFERRSWSVSPPRTARRRSQRGGVGVGVEVDERGQGRAGRRRGGCERGHRRGTWRRRRGRGRGRSGVCAVRR